MAKPQRPRPTVRVSRDPDRTAASPRPIARKPTSAPPTSTADRRPIRRQPRGEPTPTNGTNHRPVPTVLPAPIAPPVDRNPGGPIISIPPATPRPGRTAVATVPESTVQPSPAAQARSATTRSREAGLRLFGDYSYVRHDLRRVAVLTVSALVLLIVLSFLLPLWLK